MKHRLQHISQSASHTIPQLVFHCSTLMNTGDLAILCHVNW